MAEPAGSPQAAESSSPFSSSLAALDPEFPPQSRRRSCTWPLPRPELVAVVEPEPGDAAASPEEPGGGGEASGGSAGSAAGSVPGGAGGPRKGGGAGSGGARRNAWGSQSYADLISQAIQSAPDKRLTLAQIYEWMVRSVPYFRDKGDSNSSAGWKNSIRHNLSLHNKFIKVHNEATGKSSWWMLNPEGGKSGKAPRRRAASMDNSSKLAKLHGKTHRKKPAVAAAPEPTAGDSPVSQFPKWPGSPSSRSNEDSEVWTSIRPRSSSNASSVGLSSVLAEQDDLADEELLPSLVFSSASSNVPPTVTEELELIDGLNLMSASPSSLLAAQQPGSSGAETRSPPFPLRAPSSAAQASGSFGSSLFSSLDHLLPGSTGHFSQSLEELLTANSPPVSDVMMTQVDPILPQSGSRVSSQSYLLLGDQPSKPKRGLGSLLRKPLEQPLGSVGATTLPSSAFTLPAAASSQGLSALKSPGSAPSAQLGPQPAALPTPFPAFDGNADKLPNDLDVDMYMEDLQCDVDYIISTDLMDGEGLDFNFEPLPPTSSYPSTSQASNHSWVPS